LLPFLSLSCKERPPPPGSGALETTPTANSPEVVAFNGASIGKWTSVVEASGTATTEELAAGVAASRAQFTPDMDADPSEPA